LILAKNRHLKPQVIDEPASQIDLLPTVLDLLQFPDAHHAMGNSLVRQGSKSQFSFHPHPPPLIGIRQGKWKYIYSLNAKRGELYDLDADPEERCIHGDIALAEKLKSEALRQLEALEALYEHRAFASPSENTIHTHLDFAGSKSSIQKSGPIHAKLTSLNLSNQLFVTDKTLSEMARACPLLSQLDLSSCLLLTDQGVEELFRASPLLEHLDLSGLDEITGRWQHLPPHLTSLNLLDCSHLAHQELIPWIVSLPSLTRLFLDCRMLSPEHFARLEVLSNLWTLHVQNGKELQSLCLETVLKKNPFLGRLVLHGCPQIDDLEALHATKIRNLELLDCPEVGDSEIAALLDIPLVDLRIIGCPRVTSRSIEPWRAKEDAPLIAWSS
jgi:hypothetical protein